MGRARRTYTDDDRERARVAWESSGQNLSETARAMGISISTVQSWAAQWRNPPPVPLAPPEVYESVYETIRKDKKIEVINAAWGLAKAAFDRALTALPDASAKDAATVAGIAIDKAQLLSGDATDRVDIRAILATLPAPVRAAVVALAQEPDPAE